MALGTANLSAEKDSYGVIEVDQWRPDVPQLKSCGWVFRNPAGGREHFKNPFVIRPVGGNRLFHPCHVGLKPDVPTGPFLEPQNVCPKVVEVADVTRALQQVVNQFTTLR